MKIKLQTVELPDFGTPTEEPQLTKEIYWNRLDRLRTIMAERGLDFIVVYGDREHTANITYLSGYDPRFEEAALLVGRTSQPQLLVGNEGWGYAELAGAGYERVLYQSFSLLSQPREKCKGRDLKGIFELYGIGQGSQVGLAGWKYFSDLEFDHARHVFEVPHYIVETLREITGATQHLENVGDIFMNPENGLRILNEATQLAVFEYAACFTSGGLKNVLLGMKIGASEQETATLMKVNGLPMGAHLMLTNGLRAAYGLPSPSANRLELGQKFTMALSYWGALNARAGWLVEEAQQLPENVRDYLEKLAIPYFRAIVRWYEHIGIGVKGRELYDIIQQEIGDPFFGVYLNPGHYIHIDEWVSSPISSASDIEIQSGMALQVDVIPATGTDYHTINIEDGIAIADAALRTEIAQKYPECWARIQQRRQFMQEVIGIRLKPEVLPFSNIPAYLPPFVLSPEKVLVVERS